MAPQDRLAYLGAARSVLVQSQRLNDRLSTQAAQQAQDVDVYGDTEIIGVGTAAYDIQFPVLFIEQPSFSYGLEIADIAPFGVGLDRYPTGTVAVSRWIYRKIGSQDYWVGATLFVDISVGGTTSKVFHSFVGRALRSPGLNSVGGAETI